MAIRPILLLGDPTLYEKSSAVVPEELAVIKPVVRDLEDTLMDFRSRHKAGRAIAAPQIGVRKRLLYMNTGNPVVFINPVLDLKSPELMDIWDDCMSFPDLLVKVRRHRRCRIRFKDLDWKDRELSLEGDLAELLQHEYDHLDGILAVSRAVDSRAFALKSQRSHLK